MIIDLEKCSGCYNCFLACRDEHCGNDFPPYSLAQPMEGHFWMRLLEFERGKYPKVKVDYLPLTCMHCGAPVCASVAESGAVYRREDGIVIIDPEKAKGQKQIAAACPYRVIYWNEEKNLPQKCTMCAHLLDQGWREPRCVEACPTGALVFGDLEDPASTAGQLACSGRCETYRPEFNLQGGVHYIGLPKKFIAGTVLFDDTGECAENVSVTLEGQAGQIMHTITNNFGDFELDGLLDNVIYTITLYAPGYSEWTNKVRTQRDIYLGVIKLLPALA
ncbi:hypothetical protein SY88_02370 [Clostridiales bacterium PH28_bin88]|nr:hypothetical protein SY88_02370 [Clostridiales bacterium PH28_bin88]